MGSIGLFYSILQTHLTNAWLDHRWKVRLAIFGLGFSLPFFSNFFGDSPWVKIVIFGVFIAASLIFLPLLYGFFELEHLSTEEVQRKENQRALERIVRRETRQEENE